MEDDGTRAVCVVGGDDASGVFDTQTGENHGELIISFFLIDDHLTIPFKPFIFGPASYFLFVFQCAHRPWKMMRWVLRGVIKSKRAESTQVFSPHETPQRQVNTL
jgi:hypothetical protein